MAALLVVGCNNQDPEVPGAGPPAISGGTLHVTLDNRFVIAADPARAAIHIVDLTTEAQVHRIQLTENDEPGRIAEDSEGRVHVVLRRAGELLTLDPASGAIQMRRTLCAAPRGIDVDPRTGELVVACAAGELIRLPAAGGDVTSSVTLVPDLRDVVAQDGRVIVSRFRSAEVLIVAPGGSFETVTLPPGSGIDIDSMVPTVAWRMRETSDGRVLILHQYSESSQLGVLGGSSGVYYGGGCTTGVVVSRATILDPDSPSNFQVLGFDNTALAVDIVEDDTNAVYIAAAAEPGAPLGGFEENGRYNGVREVAEGQFGPPGLGLGRGLMGDCAIPLEPMNQQEGPAVALAVAPDGRVVAQYRDPAMLVIQNRTGSIGNTEIPLDGGSVEHLGHALFHEATEQFGASATCAGCHPEGGEDGHVWLFESGIRRTQTTAGGILQTAPFHWGGEVEGVADVFQGTFVTRMGGEMPRPEELENFGEWMDAIPAMPGITTDPGAIARGQAIFESAGAGCTNCHNGALLQSAENASVDVGTGGSFQVPGLFEVVYHTPYFHHGAADTLEEVLDMHGDARTMGETERSDLVAYLSSL